VARRLVSRRALRRVRWTVVGASRQQLREHQREDELACELGVRARARLGAQQHCQPTVSHFVKNFMRAATGLPELRHNRASTARNPGLTDRSRA